MRTWHGCWYLLLVGAITLAAGCLQGVGERCQLDSDCEEGLRCVTSSSQTVPPEGECQPEGAVLDAGTDAESQTDAPAQADAASQEDAEAQADAPPQEDAPPPDAGTD